MTEYYIYIVLIIVIVISFKIFLKKKEKRIYGYALKNVLLTRPESLLFDILMEFLGDKYFVFPKIHLSAILEHNVSYKKNWNIIFHNLNTKSVDFLVCDKVKMEPLLIIELDDDENIMEYKLNADGATAEQILSEIRMPILHIASSGFFDKTELHKLISEKLQ